MTTGPAAATPAMRELARLGIPFTLHPYPHDPSVRSFGDEAASALGLSTEVVFKTLVTLVDDSPAIAVLPVSGLLDMKAFATTCSGRRADLADLALAQRITGYVTGGISPIGQKRVIRTVVDEQAWLHDVVYVSGGRRGLDIGLAPGDLIRVTNATVAAIARAGSA
jgi:Cys-tRNA(Pro)/Cys-tRNA(Cys) deacylase